MCISGKTASAFELPEKAGGDQGDAMTGIVFPLAYCPAAAAVENAARTIDPSARVYTYQDDLELICLSEAVPSAKAAFARSTAAAGLRTNSDKDHMALGRGVTLHNCRMWA